MKRCAVLAAAASAWLTAEAEAQLRIVQYNTHNSAPRPTLPVVLQALSLESINGIMRAPDILTIQEVDTSLSRAEAVKNALNTIYGAGTYARSTLAGASTDGMTQAVVYRTAAVTLVEQVQVGTASTSGAPRAPLRFKFRPVGYSSQADFFIYNSHYKAGDTSADRTRREVEANTIRANADTLGNAHLIYAGDFNTYSSTEAGYQKLLSAGNGQAFDPINTPGSWSNNSAFAAVHTQSPALTSSTATSGLTLGGMDDRFDFQLMSNEMLDGEGLSYIGLGVTGLHVSPTMHSYRAFGNNGTTFNKDINNASNTALPASTYTGSGTMSRTAVLNALYSASDHVPVVTDIQLPAKMLATLGAYPSQMIVGGTASVSIGVANSATPSVVIGADELDYAGSGGGAVSGSFGGTDNPLGGSNTHSLTLTALTAGPKTGTVSVNATSQQAENANFFFNLNWDVLNHSEALMTTAGDDTTGDSTLTIDFGTVLKGSAVAPRLFTIFNQPNSNTAKLELDGFDAIGGPFSTSLTTFTGSNALAASLVVGRTNNASFSTGTPGSFTASATLRFSDEDLPGASAPASQLLTLQLTGTVTLTSEWGVNASGEWSSGTNWTVGSPNGVDLVARFGSAILSDQTVTVDAAPVVISAIEFENSNSYNVGGAQPIQLTASSGDTEIRVLGGGSHAIGSHLILSNDLLINLPAGGSLGLGGGMSNASGKSIVIGGSGGTVTLDGPQAHAAGSSVSLNSGVLVLNSTLGEVTNRTTAIDIGGGTTLEINASQHLAGLDLAAGALATMGEGAGIVLQTDALAIAGTTGAWTAALNLNDNDLVIQAGTNVASTFADVYDQVRSGFGSGLFDGTTGIISTTAANDGSGQIGPVAALADDGVNLFLTQFNGVAVDATSIIVKFTYLGDLNLDGAVNIDDYLQLLAYYNQTGQSYVNGDMNFDGVVNIDDYLTLLSNYGFAGLASTSTLDPMPAGFADYNGPSQGSVSVPEPGSIALLAVVGACFFQCRTRRADRAGDSD